MKEGERLEVTSEIIFEKKKHQKVTEKSVETCYNKVMSCREVVGMRI